MTVAVTIGGSLVAVGALAAAFVARRPAVRVADAALAGDVA
jgi:hypothetical protein